MTGLEDDDTLLRHVIDDANFLEWHSDLGRWIPSLAAIRFDPDGMSVFIRSTLLAGGHDVSDVSTRGGTANQELTFGVSVIDTRTAGFTATASPNDDTPIGYAHGSVNWSGHGTRTESRRARRDLAARMICVHGNLEDQGPQGA